MRRRAFMTLVGSAAAWPLATRAQQSNAAKRIGFLSPALENDHVVQVVYAAFPQELQKLGWAEGRNIQIDRRWGGGDNDRIRAHARELVAKTPDVIMVVSTQATA